MTYTVATISKKEAEKQQLQQQAKNGYWQNELDSLGIEQKERKELNDDEELETLAILSNRQCFRIIK